MSKGNLSSRLDAVERHLPPAKWVGLFRWVGRQTRAEVIAERFPDGMPPDVEIHWLEWGVAK